MNGPKAEYSPSSYLYLYENLDNVFSNKLGMAVVVVETTSTLSLEVGFFLITVMSSFVTVPLLTLLTKCWKMKKKQLF